MRIQLRYDPQDVVSTLAAPHGELKRMRAALRAASVRLDLRDRAQVSVLLTDDQQIRGLNKRFRGVDKATDVLSFPQDDPIILGDIVISLETARSQAETAGWPVSCELALLAIHGLLHLLGYDDTAESDAMEMEHLTRTILEQCQVQPPPVDHPFFQSNVVSRST